MAARKKKAGYPKAKTEMQPVVVGWIHLCEWCGEEFEAKKKVGPKFCPAPKHCRIQANRAMSKAKTQ